MKRRNLTENETKMAENLRRLWDEKKKEQQIIGKKLTQETAAELMGYDTQGAVSQYLTGKIPLNTDAILLFCKVLGCNPSQINPNLTYLPASNLRGSKNKIESNDVIAYHHEDALPEGSLSIPKSKISFSAGNGHIAHYESIDDAEPAIYRSSWFQKHRINPKNVKIFEVTGDSMEPFVFSGETVLINLAENDVNNIKDGDIYAIRYGDDLRIKRLYKKLDGTLVLRSYNPEYKDEEVSPQLVAEHITIIGKVRDRSGPGKVNK